MTREQLWGIIGNIDDRFIAEAAQYDPKKCSRSPERNVIMKTKRIITLAIAAALILALGVGAYAAYGKVTGPKEAERVALQELEVWKELGLISQDISFDGPAQQIVESEGYQGNDYWYGRLFPHSYDVRWYGADKYNCNLSVDTQSGKIMCATIGARPDETDEPIDSVESNQPIDPFDLDKGFETMTLYFYDNFDDIIPADLTVDDFCTRLAGYWGFSGYRIADTVDELWYDVYWEAVDGSTRLLDLPQFTSTQYYLTVFFDGDQAGAPMYIELDNFPGRSSIVIGNRHPVG